MDFIRIQNWYKARKRLFYTKLVRGSFGAIGKGSFIAPPFHSNNPGQIFIGESVQINAFSWLDCFKMREDITIPLPRLDIGDGTYMGHRTHICACSHLKIGKNVLIADGVYISDNLHGFEDISRPMMAQPLTNPGPVTIEDEVWLGEGVCVLPNVTIGRHSVIGSNSVVTKDIPPYSVAVGIPAKVIRRYNSETKQWERVDRI
jgi:acetyltransferase-like isoleucine patch superfamily enzyme